MPSTQSLSRDEIMQPDAAHQDSELNPSGKLLSELVEKSLIDGLQTPEAFVDRFPPDAVMTELAEAPKVRAAILTRCLGLPEHTAELLSADVAGATVATALRANDVTAATLVASFAPEARVQALPWAALWAFVTGGEWWKQSTDSAVGFMKYLLERAQHHGLMDPGVWRDGLTVGKLAATLPRPLLERCFERAATLGAGNKSFSGVELFSLVSPADLVESFELPYLFDRVVLPMARRSHFLVDSGTIPPQRSTQTDMGAAADEVSSQRQGKKKKKSG